MRARCTALAAILLALAPARADQHRSDPPIGPAAPAATEDGAGAVAGEVTGASAWSGELRGFYKALGYGLRLPSGLVAASQALAALSPAAPAMPDYGGTAAHLARAWATVGFDEWLELRAGWQVAATIASEPTFLGAGLLGGGVPQATTQGASRRLVDLEPVLARRAGFLLQHDLDLLALTAHAPFGDLTVGRQVLSWGSGRLWNPTDLLSPFAPTDVDREVRRGVDALRLSLPLAATAQLDLLWLPQPAARDQGGVLRGQLNLAGFDVAALAAKYVRDLVLGLDLAGDLGPLGVHGELAWTWALDRTATGQRPQFLRAVTGLDARPAESLVLTGEYYFNGWGVADPAGYLAVLQSARVARGEVFGAGRHYLGLAASWLASELLTVQALALANLTDPSLMLVPALEYWAEQSVLVRVGGVLPLGRPPDARALRALTPADAAQNTAAFQAAAASLGLRSEYGAAPFGVFVQLGVYLRS